MYILGLLIRNTQRMSRKPDTHALQTQSKTRWHVALRHGGFQPIMLDRIHDLLTSFTPRTDEFDREPNRG